MAVMPHEGTYNILYGSYGVPVGSRTQPGYVARPDAKGAYPAVVVVPGIYGLTSFEKDLCRALARRGFAAISVDSYRGRKPRDLDEAVAAYATLPDRRALTDIDEVIGFSQSPDLDWSRSGPVGVFGVDTGGRFALLAGAHRPGIGSVVAVHAPLAGDEDRQLHVADALERLTIPVLGLYGRDDDLIPAEGVDVAAEMNATGQWILYDDTGHDFMNPDRPGYHAGAAHDAITRIGRFLAATLPSAELVIY